MLLLPAANSSAILGKKQVRMDTPRINEIMGEQSNEGRGLHAQQASLAWSARSLW